MERDSGFFTSHETLGKVCINKQFTCYFPYQENVNTDSDIRGLISKRLYA